MARKRHEAPAWRNRVKELRYVRPAELADHPLQWRVHPETQAAALKGILGEIGIAGALLAYESPTTGLTSIDGHLRKSLDADVPWPTLILDVDDAEAAMLLATHDPLAAMASSDTAQLTALLHSVQSGEAGVQALLSQLAEDAGIAPPREERMPEPGDAPTETIADSYQILITCDSEAEQRELLARFTAEGLQCKALLL
jgi:hypothetical protein